MRIKHTFIYFFSLFSIGSFAQETVQLQDEEKKERYAFNAIVGVDVINAGIGLFSDRKLFQGFISSKIKEKVHAVVDLGYEKNVYDKNGYYGDVKGGFGKLGAMYMLMQDQENNLNGFYVGGKIAASLYQQHYTALPVKGYGGLSASTFMPASNQNSYWGEVVMGGRIRVFETKFYIDMNFQPKFLLHSTKQNGVSPMVIPGFGKSSGRFNIGYSWNIAYSF